MKKILRYILMTSLMMAVFASCSKDDEEILNKVNDKEEPKEEPKEDSTEDPTEQPSEKSDSIKMIETLNKLYGAWSMSRDDSGMPIITTFELKKDSIYSYTQEIQENSPYTLSLSGRWTYDLKKNELSFVFTDSLSEGLNLNATFDEKQSSFIIADEYSAMDKNKFTKN